MAALNFRSLFAGAILKFADIDLEFALGPEVNRLAAHRFERVGTRLVFGSLDELERNTTSFSSNKPQISLSSSPS